MNWLNFKALLTDADQIAAFDKYYQIDQHEKLTLFFYVTLLHLIYDNGEVDSLEEKEEFAHIVIKEINVHVGNMPAIIPMAQRLNSQAFFKSADETLAKIGKAGDDGDAADRLALVLKAAQAYATSYQKRAKEAWWDAH